MTQVLSIFFENIGTDTQKPNTENWTLHIFAQAKFQTRILYRVDEISQQ